MASGGSKPPTGGFGRGGRGLAILELLKKEEAKAPGQVPAGAGRGGVLALGRAAALQQQQPYIQPLAQPQHDTQAQAATPQIGGQVSAPQQQSAAAPRPTLGRGNMAGMLALVQQQKQGGQTAGFRGRGAVMAQAAAAAAAQKSAPGDVPGPGPSAPSSVPLAGSGDATAPTGAMAAMSIGGEEEPRPDRTRAPTVSRRGAPGKAGGTSTQLAVNYIRLSARNKNVYQYHVSFSPVVDSRGMRFGLLNEHRDDMPPKLFDGSIMYLPQPMPQDETRLYSTRKTDGANITILIRLTKVVPSEQCPQLFNILLRRIQSILNLVQVGRYYYNPATPSKVPAHKLEVWPGYITSIMEQEGGLLLLLDSSHKVLRCQTVHDLMTESIHQNPNHFHEEVMRKVVGCTVLTRYNNKTYRVDDIDWSKNPLNTFESSNGEQITFADYYRTQYGKDVDPGQPLLVHRPKAKRINGVMTPPRTELICLIPELCHLTGLTDDLRNNYTIMKDLSAHTRPSPTQRLAAMKKFIDSVKNNAEARKELDNWGLILDDSALSVEGRRMAMETVFFGGGKFASAGAEADWGREFNKMKVITPVDLEQWAIFYVKKNSPDVMNFIQELSRTGPQLGIQVRQPAHMALPDDKTETLIRALRETVNPRTQLVVIVMPTRREDKYSAVKKFACADVPVPSQVIVHRTIRDARKLRSVTQKIALQINCKLGGELWAVKNPLETAMVVGIDTFHDIARGRSSIGGFVASTNPELTRWFSKCTVQMKGEELMPGLRMSMLAAIRKYHEVNHRRPEKIIVYRDGVGDGQISTVQGYEIQSIVDAFKDFDRDYSPKLTVIIVGKRINTRMFQQRQGGQLDNPPPGTVLDHTVTRRDMYDFFVVSQHVRQGTVSPTHYVVIHDEINLPPERMQVLTYKMTHLYYNWPGTVRVPAPCLYAHKLAYLVGESIHKEPSELLSDRLFFL